MPIYEYRCETCGHTFEVLQRFSDEPVTVCESCGGPVNKVFHPVAIHFKGSGFYTTDYGRSSSFRGTGGSDGGSESGSSSGDSESGSSDGGKTAEKSSAPVTDNGSPARQESAKQTPATEK